MAAVLLLVAWSLAISSAVAGEWSTISNKTAPATVPTVQHRRIVAESSGTRATLDLAIFSPGQARLRVVDSPGADDSLAETMVRIGALAGVNGGYFDPDYAPVGMLISDGRVIVPKQKARLLSGVVSVSGKKVRVQRASEFSMKPKPDAARQCGPFLVERGRAVSGLNNERAARRTFVGLLADGQVALGYCSSVTLAELADVLAAAGGFQQAMNLDGGSSSGFWFSGKDGIISLAEGKRVRDFLAIVPR